MILIIYLLKNVINISILIIIWKKFILKWKFLEIEEYNIICTNYLHHKHHSGGERSRSVSNSGW